MLLRSTLARAKILIVDDEAANVRLLERILDLIGCPPEQIVSTQDSSLAPGLFREFRPDLVLLDLHMPPPDGFALLELFKQDTGEADSAAVPVLALTADVSAKTKHRALTAGARDFLTKPIDQPEVILRIKNLLENRFLQGELQAQNGRLEDQVRERTAQLELTLTRLQEAQQGAIKHERLNALGTMAAGVAHDFNNALTLIHGYSELLLVSAERVRPGEEFPAPERTEAKYIRTIMLAARDAASVVSRLRAFYRPDDGGEVRVPVQLSHLIDQAIALTAPRWLDEARARGRNIEVCREFGDLPPVDGDPAELREMLTNLIFNAVDAQPKGGKITLRAHLKAGGDTVLLEVADTGTGMSEEVRRRCLEPFFTTKGDDGTGLGLSAVYGIIQRHGGTIDIDSAPGRGTRFMITFPVAGGVPDTHAPLASVVPTETVAAVAATGRGGVADATRTLRILVVDDQPVIRNLLQEHLERDGHQVITAGSGTEALEKFRAAPCDLLLTDQAMPGMNGAALGSAVKEEAPGTPVILLTGFGDMLGSPTPGGDVDLVLNKPVTLMELRRAIAGMLTR